MRFSLFRQDVLISLRIRVIYPPRVSYSRGRSDIMAHDEQGHGGESPATNHHAGHQHGGHHHDHKDSTAACCGGKSEAVSELPEVAIDPVCGMKVTRATAKHR